VRPSYGSVLLPLFEEDGLRIGEIAARSRLSKQTMTTLVRLAERDGLVTREADPEDGRATRIRLTARAREFASVAERVLEQLEKRVDELLGSRESVELRAALSKLTEL
jgi:DNA-binding MarR family transcriptional regulator